MAIKRIYKKRFKGIGLITGNFYQFKYLAWQHDPKPLIIFMYTLEGIHPRSGHQWRFVQGLNLSYLPKNMRSRFVKTWSAQILRTGNTRFTWQLVEKRFPKIKYAVRRYFIKPNYYITKLNHIPFEDIQDVTQTIRKKDFSRSNKRRRGVRR